MSQEWIESGSERSNLFSLTLYLFQTGEPFYFSAKYTQVRLGDENGPWLDLGEVDWLAMVRGVYGGPIFLRTTVVWEKDSEEEEDEPWKSTVSEEEPQELEAIYALSWGDVQGLRVIYDDES